MKIELHGTVDDQDYERLWRDLTEELNFNNEIYGGRNYSFNTILSQFAKM